MKTAEILKKILINTGKNVNHINPSLEGLCGIIDRQNRRIDALERVVNKAAEE